MSKGISYHQEMFGFHEAKNAQVVRCGNFGAMNVTQKTCLDYVKYAADSRRRSGTIACHYNLFSINLHSQADY